MEENFIIYQHKSVYNITEQSAIRKALGIENKFPYSFLKPLVAVAMYRFNGDNLPKSKSLNDLFEIGKEYPVYYVLGGNQFVITGKGTPRKMMLGAWKFVKTL